MTHHGEGLLRLTKDAVVVQQLKDDYTNADLSAEDAAMLQYAAKLTKEPWNMKETDVAHLREAGFPDQDILHINMIAGYYAFVNRLADGLGVELEEPTDDTI
jgi:uncharacterized peroxidase-related enzyme